MPGRDANVKDALLGADRAVAFAHGRLLQVDADAKSHPAAMAAALVCLQHFPAPAPRGCSPGDPIIFIVDGGQKIQFGTQAAALISPNSRAILRQDAPASSVTYTSPKRLNATMRSASAGCVTRPHTVALGWVGSGRISQLSPKFAVRSTCPFSPVVVSPHPTNSTPGSSALTAMPRA